MPIGLGDAEKIRCDAVPHVTRGSARLPVPLSRHLPLHLARTMTDDDDEMPLNVRAAGLPEPRGAVLAIGGTAVRDVGPLVSSRGAHLVSREAQPGRQIERGDSAPRPALEIPDGRSEFSALIRALVTPVLRTVANESGRAAASAARPTSGRAIWSLKRGRRPRRIAD
jgi:hypothetical protein